MDFIELRKRLLNLDFFNLGFSFLLYYCVIFSILPIALYLGATTDLTNLEAHGVHVISPTSLLYVLIGFLFFALGYYGVGRKISRKPLAAYLDKPWDPRRSSWVVFGLLVAGFAIKAPRAFGNLSASNIGGSVVIYDFLSLNVLHFIALAVAFSQYFALRRENDDRARLWRGIAWSLFFVEFLVLLAFAPGRMSVVVPVLIYLLTRHYLYRRSAARILLVGLALVLVMFPLKSYIKNKANLDEQYFSDKQSTQLHRTSSSDTIATARLVIDSSVGRLGQSHIFTAIVERTYYFLYGRGFLDFFKEFDVSSYFGQKPFFTNDGNDFGKAYGIISQTDFLTGIGPTQIGDLYINFGLGGIMVGMFLIGVLFRFLFDNVAASASVSGVMCYSILWVQLIHGFEDWISLTYAKHIKILLVLLAIHLLLTVRSRSFDMGFRQWLTVGDFKTKLKVLPLAESKPAVVAFAALVVVSTVLSQTLISYASGAYSQAGTLSTLATYQVLLRDVGKCEALSESFRGDLEGRFLAEKIGASFAASGGEQEMYIQGLIQFAQGDYEQARRRFQSAAGNGYVAAMRSLGMMYERGLGVELDYRTAVKWYAAAMEHGSSRDLTKLATLHLEGKGVPHDTVRALQLLTRAAATGDAQAEAWLGSMYEAGAGVAQDLEKAVKLYRKAMHRGDAMATVRLARMYETGHGVIGDPIKAGELYLRAARQGNIAAMQRVSVLYETGQGIPKEEGSAMVWAKHAARARMTEAHDAFMEQYYSELSKWSQSSAKKGDPVAMRNLGVLYAEGLSVPKDLSRALAWFVNGAERGDALSMRNVGIMYERGMGIGADSSKAREWYTVAAAKGDAVSARHLGRLHEGGRQGTGDPERAYEWYRKAAEAGDDVAMCNLGRMHYFGYGVTTDVDKAIEWYRRATENGNTDAMNNLGFLYETGRGVKQDYAVAFHWYEKSAQGGDFVAMRNLGLMYENGRGTERSYDQALKWYRDASRGGDVIARTKLSKQ